MNPGDRGLWHVRSYRPGDERAIVELFREAYGRTITEAYWRWKLKAQPSPVDNVGLAVGEDDRPVFHLAGIPCRFQMGPHQVTVMVAVDAMTTPRLRRRGLLATVGHETLERWREGGVALALGLPNEQYNKSVLGWQTLFPCRWLVHVFRPERILARRLGWSSLGRWRLLGTLWSAAWHRTSSHPAGLVVRELDAASPALDALWQRCRRAIRFSVVRDRGWVAWRYFAAPHVRYRVLLAERGGEAAGYAAYTVRGSGERRWGIIAELFAAPGDRAVAEALTMDVVRRLGSEDVDGVATLATPGTWLYRVFRRAGFLFSWGAFSVECVLFTPELALADLRDRKAWYLAGGDFDVV